MKSLSLVLFTATIAAAVTASVVGAQIVFPDGTQQTTAFRIAVPPPGSAFAEVVPFFSSDNLIPISPGVIPTGKELVVLQVRFSYIGPVDVFFSLESRLPFPDESVGPPNPP